jgi:hypothetical protein
VGYLLQSCVQKSFPALYQVSIPLHHHNITYNPMDT